MRVLRCRKLALLFMIGLLYGACGNSASGPRTTTSSTPAASPSPLTEFEKDLQYVRNGQFTYVWVFSRKDGKPLDREDSDFLRKNAPQVVDWVGTDQGRKIIAGTNFNLEEGNLEALKKRFVAENFSNR